MDTNLTVVGHHHDFSELKPAVISFIFERIGEESGRKWLVLDPANKGIRLAFGRGVPGLDAPIVEGFIEGAPREEEDDLLLTFIGIFEPHIVVSDSTGMGSALIDWLYKAKLHKIRMGYRWKLIDLAAAGVPA